MTTNYSYLIEIPHQVVNEEAFVLTFKEKLLQNDPGPRLQFPKFIPLQPVIVDREGSDLNKKTVDMLCNKLSAVMWCKVPSLQEVPNGTHDRLEYFLERFQIVFATFECVNFLLEAKKRVGSAILFSDAIAHPIVPRNLHLFEVGD